MRILVFGDDYGIPQLVKHLPSGTLAGIVASEMRPHQHAALLHVSKSYGVPLLIQPRPTSADYDDFFQRVRNVGPDLIMVHSYSMLILRGILSIPRLGAINIHGALLPQYRGANPTQWALLNNETETGVTMHYMTPEFDAGDIIDQRRVPIYFEDTWRDIHMRIAEATEGMLAENMSKVLKGTTTRQSQDHAKAHYYRRRHPEDGLIDWKQAVLYIYNLIRALVKPNPGAFYCEGGCKIVLEEYLSIPQVTALKYNIGKQALKSSNLFLRPIVSDDFPVILKWINNHEQVLFTSPYKPLHIDQTKHWFDTIQRRNDLVIFSIHILENNKLIGMCHLQSINYVHRSTELQIRLEDVAENSPRYFNETVCLVLDYAFKDLNLQRVSIHVLSTDSAVIQVYEKVGFVHEGLLRKAAYINGSYVDVILMGILRKEYVR